MIGGERVLSFSKGRRGKNWLEALMVIMEGCRKKGASRHKDDWKFQIIIKNLYKRSETPEDGGHQATSIFMIDCLKSFVLLSRMKDRYLCQTEDTVGESRDYEIEEYIEIYNNTRKCLQKLCAWIQYVCVLIETLICTCLSAQQKSAKQR